MSLHPTIEAWQRTGHEVGVVQFVKAEDALNRFPHPIPPGFIPIGVAEAELLCVDASKDELVLFEHEVAGRISCRCAASQSHFIAAIRILEAYFHACVEVDGYSDDEAAGLNTIARATEAAGGSKYGALYHSLVGF